MTHFIRQVLALTLFACLWFFGCGQQTLLDEWNRPSEPGDLVVTFIDVGQGDAALLELPGGEVILIDGGPDGSGTRILSVLEEREIGALDLVVLSHPHGDHYGGLRFVLDSVPVGEIWENGESIHDYGYLRFREVADSLDILTVIPDQDEERVMGDVTLRVLNREEGYEERNNDSLVLKVSFGKIDILFSGDVEREESLDLVRDYGSAGLASEIVKVPHHGSADMALDFIEALAPDYAIISCGRDNLYGHPHSETLEAYQKMGTTLYRTDTHGNVTLTIDYDSEEFTFEFGGIN